MPALPVDTRRVHLGGVSFRPSGPLRRAGPIPNPKQRIEEIRYAARLLVGFNVGAKPRWRMSQLVAFVKKYRIERDEDPSATFFYTKGIYRGSGGVVDEDGAQIVVLDFSGKPKRFIKQMRKLGMAIVRKFKQEEVIVQIQRDGGHYRAWKMIPKETK